MNKKRIVLVVLLIVLVGFGGFITYKYLIKDVTPSEKLFNESRKGSFTDDKEFMGLKFVQIEKDPDKNKKGNNTLSFVIKNTSKEKHETEYLVFHFIDKKGNTIDTLSVIVPEMEANTQMDVELVINNKMYNAHNFVIIKQ